jgi:hypothetical protein
MVKREKAPRETAASASVGTRHAHRAPRSHPPFKEIFSFLSLLLFLSACGRKLPPVAPLLVLPARVDPVRISQEGGDVVLRFPVPTVTNAGAALTNLTKVTVTREIAGAREGQRVSPPPSDAAQRAREERLFKARAQTIGELGPADLAASSVGPDVVFRDALAPLYGEKRIGRVMLRYAVTATRDKKRISDLSEIVSIIPRVPPDRPLGILPTVEENRVCLDWLPPDAMLDGATPAVVAGYAIYRREASDEEYDDKPLGVALGATTYVDETVRPDRAYVYTVRAAPVADLPLILGPAADQVLVSTRDVFPPPAPDGLLVLVESGGTRLVWNPSLAPDFAFYRVYGLEAGGRSRLADGLKDPFFFDAGASGRAYGVTAVDKSGNESPIGTAK